MHVCIYLHVMVYDTCVQVHVKARGGVRSLETGLTDDCELPNMDAEKQTQAF